jgi:hypothetical protein
MFNAIFDLYERIFFGKSSYTTVWADFAIKQTKNV